MASDTFVVAVSGLDALRAGLEKYPANIDRIQSMAINEVAAWARAEAGREIREQANFPRNYLTGRDGRLYIKKRAKAGDTEAIITGRQRATSLARFSNTRDIGIARRRGGVNVEVKPGVSKFMKGAFLMRLRAGNTLTDTQHNLGLAIRLKPGERVRNKTQMAQIAKNLYLLYGPSVDQIFRSVADNMTPDIEGRLRTEFDRLIEVSNRGTFGKR